MSWGRRAALHHDPVGTHQVQNSPHSLTPPRSLVMQGNICWSSAIPLNIKAATQPCPQQKSHKSAGDPLGPAPLASSLEPAAFARAWAARRTLVRRRCCSRRPRHLAACHGPNAASTTRSIVNCFAECNHVPGNATATSLHIIKPHESRAGQNKLGICKITNRPCIRKPCQIIKFD